MLIMEGCANKVNWNLERAVIKIGVNNLNNGPILRLELLDLKQSLKLTVLSI
jgi:hypothetical protein